MFMFVQLYYLDSLQGLGGGGESKTQSEEAVLQLPTAVFFLQQENAVMPRSSLYHCWYQLANYEPLRAW